MFFIVNEILLYLKLLWKKKRRTLANSQVRLGHIRSFNIKLTYRFKIIVNFI